MKITKRKILGLIALLLFTIFVMLLSRIENATIVDFDNYIYALFKRTDSMTSIMKVITYLGEACTLVPLAVLALICIPNKKEAVAVPINLILIASLNSAVKNIVERPRPVGIRLIEIGGFSFPSGHSASSLAFYGFLMYLIYRNCKNVKIKVALMAMLGVLILAIGASRIYLGVHFASDVLGGFIFASLYLIIYILLCDKLRVFE